MPICTPLVTVFWNSFRPSQPLTGKKSRNSFFRNIVKNTTFYLCYLTPSRIKTRTRQSPMTSRDVTKLLFDCTEMISKRSQTGRPTRVCHLLQAGFVDSKVCGLSKLDIYQSFVIRLLETYIRIVMQGNHESKFIFTPLI